MLQYIRGAEQLSFDTTGRITGVLNRRAEFKFLLRQPKQFKITVKENAKTTTYISDGTVLSIYRPSDGRHASIPAKESMLTTMYVSAGLTSLMGRVLNFFWAAELADQASAISTLPPIRVHNAECTGVRLDRFEETFEVWISKSGPPLPCKLISRRIDGAATIIQTNTFLWNTEPRIPDDTFKFVPPISNKQSSR